MIAAQARPAKARLRSQYPRPELKIVADLAAADDPARIVQADIAGAEVEPVGVPQRPAEMAAEVEPAPIAEQRLGRCWAHRDKP